MNLLQASFLTTLFFIIIIQFVYIYQIKKQAKSSPPPPSEELSGFLRDVRSHGYGFVRVNPDNVFLRK